jgi:hypothetical protein
MIEQQDSAVAEQTVSATTGAEVQLLEDIFKSLVADLGMIADRPVALQGVSVAVACERVAGPAQIHISFKLGIQEGRMIEHGAWIVPLPDAIALAGYVMMLPDDGVRSKRALATLDPNTKDAMLELGNFIGAATEAALRQQGYTDLKVRSEGCQGVKPDVRPAFKYNEGAELLIGRSKIQLHTWPSFDAILLLPRLAAFQQPA